MVQAAQFQVIDGGKVKEKAVPLNQFQQESIANRFLFHDAKRSTLAWESGHTQHDLCALIVAIAQEEAFENGMRAERARRRLLPPVGRAA